MKSPPNNFNHTKNKRIMKKEENEWQLKMT